MSITFTLTMPISDQRRQPSFFLTSTLTLVLFFATFFSLPTLSNADTHNTEDSTVIAQNTEIDSAPVEDTAAPQPVPTTIPEQYTPYVESKFSPEETIALVVSSLLLLLYGVLLVTTEAITERASEREEKRANVETTNPFASLGRKVTDITRTFF